MNVGWLIDGDMLPHYRGDLVTAIESQGHAAMLVHAPSPPFRGEDVGCSCRETFPKEHCVVSHGDIELVTKTNNEKRWKPGAFATVQNYFCSNYVNHFGQYWLNRDYCMFPFWRIETSATISFQHIWN
jgi:hypothetical protein